MENQEAFLEILKIVTRDPEQATLFMFQFNYVKQVYEAEREQDLILYGISKPSWEELMDSLIEGAMNGYKCTYCKEKFLCIFE
jgi:hypothetical protein